MLLTDFPPGGKGSVIGTFFGVCLLQVLSTGLVVVLAAVFDTYRSRTIASMRAR